MAKNSLPEPFIRSYFKRVKEIPAWDISCILANANPFLVAKKKTYDTDRLNKINENYSFIVNQCQKYENKQKIDPDIGPLTYLKKVDDEYYLRFNVLARFCKKYDAKNNFKRYHKNLDMSQIDYMDSITNGAARGRLGYEPRLFQEYILIANYIWSNYCPTLTKLEMSRTILHITHFLSTHEINENTFTYEEDVSKIAKYIQIPQGDKKTDYILLSKGSGKQKKEKSENEKLFEKPELISKIANEILPKIKNL